ncbi:ATPase, partial [[Eubacterium] siraeum]|nr:ATPase [[Eubacterium] siraeum]
MITLFVKNNIKVDIKLIRQYIQHDRTARSFAAYYDLYNKYRSDYQIDEILSGNASDSIKDRAENAKFDDRLSLLGLILYSVKASAKQV